MKKHKWNIMCPLCGKKVKLNEFPEFTNIGDGLKQYHLKCINLFFKSLRGARSQDLEDDNEEINLLNGNETFSGLS